MDEKETNVFHQELPPADTGADMQGNLQWDINSTHAPAGAQEGGMLNEARSATPAGYFPSQAGNDASTSQAPDVKIDFVESTAGNYTAATERVFAPGPPPAPEQASKSWFSIQYYQQYFDVDTKSSHVAESLLQVLLLVVHFILWRFNSYDVILTSLRMKDVGKRLLGALMFQKTMFLDVEKKPDLYGPFWLITTAVFLMAMVSNALDFFKYQSSSKARDVEWEGDLKKIANGASLMYGYVFGGGLALWAWLKIGNNALISLTGIICMYGYSMSVWLPVSLIAIFPHPLWIWVVCLSASVYSGVFLCLNLKQAVIDSVVSSRQYPTLVTMFAAHILLAVLLRLYVFSYDDFN